MEWDAELQVGATATRDRNAGLLRAPSVGASGAAGPAAPPCMHATEISCDG